jgi:hypothetical protein
MWHLLNLVSRGYRYYTNGVIRDPQRLPLFVEKMHRQFNVLMSASGRTKRQKRNVPNAHLVMFQDWDGVWLWWLLFAGEESRVKALAEKHREVLQDAAQVNGRLRFRDEYLLRQRQRPREQGGGRVWTWVMTGAVQAAIERQLIALAAAHGRGTDRVDDLVRAVEQLRHKPMFNGIRTQARHALHRARQVWRKTHASGVDLPEVLTATLPWFSGRIRIYD